MYWILKVHKLKTCPFVWVPCNLCPIIENRVVNWWSDGVNFSLLKQENTKFSSSMVNNCRIGNKPSCTGFRNSLCRRSVSFFVFCPIYVQLLKIDCWIDGQIGSSSTFWSKKIQNFRQPWWNILWNLTYNQVSLNSKDIEVEDESTCIRSSPP